MVAPEDIEDLISKMQREILVSLVAGTTISCFFRLTLSVPVRLSFSLSQCQRWTRLTTVWVLWLRILKIWSTLPATTLRASQLPNAKQVRAEVMINKY